MAVSLAIALNELAIIIGMFGGRAFRTWAHIVLGACVISTLFLGVMILVEHFVGKGARISRAGVAISIAAFVGYLGAGWVVRRKLDGLD